jgi:hypothetical protein
MHLQQTKKGSRKTGGPQYYFHDLPEEVRIYLREKRAVRVALMTPYGATRSDFMALSKDAKLAGEKPVKGKVGHDRIQQAKAGESIGEAIRRWYGLPHGLDFERIDVDIEIRDATFYISPVACKLTGKNRKIPLQKPQFPLSLNHHFQSQLWRKQLKNVEQADSKGYKWALQEIGRIVSAHKETTPNVLEPDILRASGPLNILGVEVGPYLGRGYDCRSCFRFLKYEAYEVPIELKRKSSGFRYQQQKYGKDELSRAVVLCVRHDLRNPPPNIDIVELGYLASYAHR